MSDNPSFFTQPNLSDLIECLRQKYEKEIPAYSSASRFPTSVIFFDSKKTYKKFLETVPYEKRCFSSVIPESERGSGYHLKRWFNQVLEEAKTKPLVLVPVTEYLRLYQEGDFTRRIHSVFSTLLQAEGVSLIVPMLDYAHAYQQFFKGFVHKQRMAEVYSVSDLEEESLNEDAGTLKLILDWTGKVPLKDATEVLGHHQWFDLWETGAIADVRTLLIRSSTLCAGLSEAEIAVPRVEKVVYRNEADILEGLYHIDPINLTLEPDEKIWDQIFAQLNTGRARTWNEICHLVLGDYDDFEGLLSQNWQETTIPKTLINRWFWLNEARRKGVKGSYLETVVETTTDPEQLMDQIYILGLTDEFLGKDELRERRQFLRGITSPHFAAGTKVLENHFQCWFKGGIRNLDDVIEHFTDLFPVERHALFDVLIDDLNQKTTVSSTGLVSLRETWPSFAAYLDIALTRYDGEVFEITDNWEQFIDRYFHEYIHAKLVSDQTTEALESLQDKYQKEWNNILGSIKVSRITTHKLLQSRDHVEEEGFLLLDAVGYEWHSVIIKLFELRGWTLDKCIPVFASFPSVTTACPLKDSIETYRSFDKLIHEPYHHPESLLREIQELEKIVDTIHSKYHDRKSPLWVVSDHGTTAFARKGGYKNFKEIEPEHGGRYCYPNGSKVAEKELVYELKGDKKDIAISLSYQNLGPTSPKGEAHGGGTLEEMLAMALRLIPPGLKPESDSMRIEPAVITCSPLDDDDRIVIQLIGNIPRPDEIDLSLNGNSRFVVDAEWLSNGGLSLSRKNLVYNGLRAEENKLEVRIDKTHTAICTIKLNVGTTKTDDDWFD